MEKLHLGNALAEGMAGRNPALDVSVSRSQLLDSHPFNQVECQLFCMQQSGIGSN